MEYKIEVDETKTVRIWLNAEGNDEPVILQEKQPDGSDWATKDEAETWAISEAEKIKANAEAYEVELAELAALAEEARAEAAPAEEPAPVE